MERIMQALSPIPTERNLISYFIRKSMEQANKVVQWWKDGCPA